MIVTTKFQDVIQINLVVSDVIFYVASAKDGHVLHFREGMSLEMCKRGFTHGYLET